MLMISADVLALSSEAAVLVRSGRIQFANSAAKAILGEGCVGSTVKSVFGVEIAEALLREAAREGLRVFFYGGRPASDGNPSVAETAAARMKEKYPELCICGTLDGYIKDEAAVISRIHDSGADILFVCLGVPKQEEFMFRNKSQRHKALLRLRRFARHLCRHR